MKIKERKSMNAMKINKIGNCCILSISLIFVMTVKTGRRYFPHCSEVLDKYLEDEKDMLDLLLEKGTPEEQRIKKMRYLELKDDVQRAFSKDMAENNHSGLSSSSSTASPKKNVMNYKARKR